MLLIRATYVRAAGYASVCSWRLGSLHVTSWKHKSYAAVWDRAIRYAWSGMYARVILNLYYVLNGAHHFGVMDSIYIYIDSVTELQA